jgi:hypothetical protein
MISLAPLLLVVVALGVSQASAAANDLDRTNQSVASAGTDQNATNASFMPGNVVDQGLRRVLQLQLTGVGGYQHLFEINLGQAGSPCAILKNVGGFWVAVCMPTNRYSLGTPIKAKLLVINGTSKGSPNLSWVDGGNPVSPGVGRWVVKDVHSGKSLAAVEIKPSPMSVSGGSIFPGNYKSFECPIATAFPMDKTGVYEITFCGKLPSITEPPKQVEFVTDPLVVTIQPSQPGATNANPTAAAPN